MVTDGGSVPRSRAWRPLVIYGAVQLVLLLISASLPQPVSGSTRDLMVTVGTVVLAVGVARHRPRPIVGWWLIVAGAVVEMAAAITVADVYGLRRGGVSISAEIPLVLAGAVLPLFAAGLVILSKLTPYGGSPDTLDAVMTALGGFLLLWTFVVEPALTTPRFSIAGAVVFTVGAVLVTAICIKLIYGGALADRSVRLLLVSMAMLIATSVVVLLPALDTAALRTSESGGVLWSLYGTFLGAVGLHPGLGRPRRRKAQRSGGLSARRVVLYGILALIAPVAWAVDLTASGRRLAEHMVGYTVPIVTSAVFLMLLVVRLGLIARVAQSRAGELARRSADLSRSVSEQKELQQQLAYRATHDPLTGLSNRTVLAERLDELLKKPPGRHAVLLLDLDGFKDVNDTLGHPTGDQLLVGVARRLADSAPPGATLARFGGDEFVVVLENTAPESARRAAEVLLGALSRSYFVGGRELFLTTSIGVMTTDPDKPRPTPSDVLRDADLALYTAKDAGKNRVMVFRPEFRAERLHHTRLSAGLRHALRDEEFVLHYQPVVELETGRIDSAEALLRWRPDGGLVPPGEFIPIAEATGIIVPIGAWALRRACQDARRWYLDHQISVSVNVSGRQLDDPDFAETVMAALASAGLPGDALIIEITESTLVTSSRTPTLPEHLHRLRSFGVRMAIDDFGTGYSSLSYVAELPIDIVKIDKSFTQTPTGPDFVPQDWAFTKAILRLVDSLHMLAVAEGVETAAQAAALRILHCPLAQGFHFAGPVPAEAIDRIIEGFGPALTGPPARPPRGTATGGDSDHTAVSSVRDRGIASP